MAIGYDPSLTGVVFDLKRFAVHDGPGIRTTIFMKGCFLGCDWCHNPESRDAKPQLMFHEQSCIGDLACFEACDHEALYLVDADGRRAPRDTIEQLRARDDLAAERVYVEAECVTCGECVAACPTEALELAGGTISVEEAYEELNRDRAFYETSGGGVTVGGGEPLYQHEFVRDLLAACKVHGLHTALDTSGYGRWEHAEAVLRHTDLVLLDLKAMDSERHRRHTGVGNETILRNAVALSEVMSAKTGDLRDDDPQSVGVWVRVPVVPSINDTQSEIAATATFVRDRMQGVRALELLPYHRLGESKFRRLGWEYVLSGMTPPAEEHMSELVAAAERELAGTAIKVKR